MVTAKGKKIPWHENITVSEVLKLIELDIPSPMVQVNGLLVRRKDWDVTEVPDDSVIDIHPILTGG